MLSPVEGKNLVRGSYRTGRDLMRLALSPLRTRLVSRRLDVCCCGLSKTGTHSMVGLFESYRSAHHPDAHVRLPLATACLNREIDATAQATLRRRDRMLWLEMESSALAGILIEPLSEACPAKRFVLTIRDVFSWCDSWIDHNINSPPSNSSPWSALDQVRLRVKDFRPTKFDSPLTSRGFPPLACYFQLWASHNAHVLDVVPSSRLLVVETHALTAKIPEIAAWAGVPLETLRMDRTWLFSTPRKHHVLATLDDSYVRETADRFCGTLMNEYFTDVSWRGASDAERVREESLRHAD